MNHLERKDFYQALVWFVLALIIRLPFRSQFLYHWDSVNFALSLEKYDVRIHQPHPPGYILYSLLGRLVNYIFNDANSSLVWISLLGGALGVSLIYLAGKILHDQRTGVVAAVLTLANSLHWFYSEIALTYALEFMLVIPVVVLCYLQLNRSRKVWAWLAVLLGIAGGVRQNDLLFLVPLWAVSLLFLDWKRRIGSVMILTAVVLVWMLPMMSLSGDPVGYLEALASESSGIASDSSFLEMNQLILNTGRIFIFTSYGLLLGWIPILWGGIIFLRSISARMRNVKTWLYFLWIVPAALFYVFVHIRQHGHIFTFLPAIILLEAAATSYFIETIRDQGSQRAASFIIPGILFFSNLVFFMAAPPALFGSKQLPLQTPSRQSLKIRDQVLDERFTAIRSTFDPARTTILAGGDFFRHPDYYLRDYQEAGLSYNLGVEQQVLPETIHTIILFDEEAFPDYRNQQDFNEIHLQHSQLWFITISIDQQFIISRDKLMISNP